MALIVLVRMLVVYEFIVLLIEREVRQMTVQLLLAQGGVVLVHCETRQPIIVNVDAPGVHARNARVDAQIKLQSVDKEGIRNVPGDDAVLVNGNLGDVVDLHSFNMTLATPVMLLTM